jgi:ketosteroid isomerase-like protein
MWQHPLVSEADVQRWLDRYVEAWRSYDAEAIAALFTDDAEYRYDPFAEPLVGGAAIAADWLRDRDAPGSWEAEYRPFAVTGDRAVATGETRYPLEGKRYANAYVLEFAPDGRCRSLTEWYFRERTG